MSWFGLGKRRSKFGRWIDSKGITQEEIRKRADVGNGTMTSMCNDEDYVPKISTWVKVKRALKSMGYDVDSDKFFDT
jgi:hypothetical protein